MSTYYEFSLMCEIKPDVSQQVIDTLQYMTRAEGDDTPFETTLHHSLFTDSQDQHFTKEEALDFGSDEAFTILADWKIIIANFSDCGEEMLSGSFASEFHDHQLKVRKFLNDDEFYNAFPQLIDCLFLNRLE